MDKFEKLVLSIMKDAEKDGEPVTREEAEEMAKMELGAKSLTRYEQKEPTKKANRVRKVDEEKKYILENVKNLLMKISATNVFTKTETEISFAYGENEYTFKLIKHRKEKKQ